MTPGASTDSAQSGAGDPQQSGGASNTSQTGANGPQDTFSHPEKLPPLNLFSEATGNTGLTLFTSVGTLVQRVSETRSTSYWQTLAAVNGGISISQYRPALLWSFTYNGGTNLSSTSGYYNTSLSQAGNARIAWNFAKRWQLRIKDNYLYSNDPFQPFLTYLGQPTPNNPNPVVYIPNAIVAQNTGNIDVSYRLAAHDTVNFSGGESFQHFIRGYNAQWNSFTYSGGVFYQHDFSARFSGGGGYLFQAIDFGHGTSRAGVNWFQGFATYQFSPRLQVSGWVGPELTHTKDLIPIFCSQYGCLVEVEHRGSWNVAEGGTLTWQVAPGNALGLQVAHQITNGGGLLGIARTYQGALTYSRPLTRAWSLGLGLLYNDSLSESAFRAAQYLKSWAGTAGFGRKVFNDAWSFNAYYAYIRQSSNFFGRPSTGSSNGLGLSLSYAWNHALGR